MTTYTWNGISGDWDNGSNWTPSGGPPTSSDSAIINGMTSDQIIVDSADVANSLTLSDFYAELLDEGPLTIGGTFTMSNGRCLLYFGGDLTVGSINFSSGELVITEAQLNLNGTLIQTGGQITLNDGGTISGGTIDLTAGQIYSDATETNVITSKVLNDGTITVAYGKLEIDGSVTGNGTDTITNTISNYYASKLEFDKGVDTAATLGDQDIDFTGGGTLALLEPARFYGEISNFGPGDTINLEDSWKFSAISGEIGGVTTLTLHRGSTTHDFEFVGDYTRSDFSITPGKITKITYA